jgi:hypothetical protein
MFVGRKAAAVICEPTAFTIWDPQQLNPIGLHGLLRGELYFYFYFTSGVSSHALIISVLPRCYLSISFPVFTTRNFESSDWYIGLPSREFKRPVWQLQRLVDWTSTRYLLLYGHLNIPVLF